MKTIEIKKIEITNLETEMFDLEVEDNHNFILGNGILTHNSGKTAFSYEFLDWHKAEKRPEFVYKFPQPELLPGHITNTIDLNKVPKGSVVLIDESSMEFNQFSFNSKPSQALVDMIKVARHNDLSLIFISQNGQMLTRDVRRLVDTYILKTPSYAQLYDEVSIIKRMYQNCFMLFKAEEIPQKAFYIAEIGEFGYADLPDYWTEEISKAYATNQDDKKHKNISTWIKKTIGLNRKVYIPFP